jgi:hypothetical protein
MRLKCKVSTVQLNARLSGSGRGKADEAGLDGAPQLAGNSTTNAGFIAGCIG